MIVDLDNAGRAKLKGIPWLAPEQMKAYVTSQIPFGRIGLSQEIASAALFPFPTTPASSTVWKLPSIVK